MHLGRFHYAIDLLVIEYVEEKIGERLSQVINTLNAVSTTPNNPEIAKQFKVALDALRATLVASKLNTPRPVLALILNSISADRYIGEALFSKIRNAIDANQLAPAMAVQELQKIQKEVQAFFAHATAI
ncbi:MAG TPA: hypothetical protein VFM46_03130, partial [Pseudomonadales bacterium]|nr:hypothetical protein [Pseudomonadales bacterium]